MESGKKDSRFGAILAYSFVGIVALAFIVGPIIEIFSLPSGVRVVVIIAIVLVLFLVYSLDSTNKYWEDKMRDKEREIRNLHDKNLNQYHKMSHQIRDLQKENAYLRQKIEGVEL